MHYQQATLNGNLPENAHELLWEAGVFTRMSEGSLTITGSVENVGKALKLFESWQSEEE